MSQGLPKTRAEVKDLHRLRQLFLEAPNQQGLADYWSDPELLQLYDATYARRIGWKWAAVLTELNNRNWAPPSTGLRWIDWGCGSAVASELMLQYFSSSFPEELVLSDRSAIARKYAQKKISTQYPQLKVTTCASEDLNISKKDLLLVSHVATELKDDQFRNLLDTIRRAGTVIWVEPGTPFCSEKLITARSILLDDFSVVAPCPHAQSCPLAVQSSDWCHFFAPPPRDVFHDPQWSKFSKELNIDLRSLPVSFLVLQHTTTPLSLSQSSVRGDRLLARPRFYKGYAKVMLCGADGQFKAEQLKASEHKKDFKQWEKDCFNVEITNVQDCD